MVGSVVCGCMSYGSRNLVILVVDFVDWCVCSVIVLISVLIIVSMVVFDVVVKCCLVLMYRFSDVIGVSGDCGLLEMLSMCVLCVVV